MGLAFAFGWTPCIGPVLATVLTLAANEASLGAGVRLLFVYSLGLGIPFILAAVAIGPFLGFLQRFRRHLGRVEMAMGLLLVVTGVLILTGGLNWFGTWMIENVPVLAASRNSSRRRACRPRSSKRAHDERNGARGKDRNRAYYCRLRQLGRRGHPGRPQDVLGLRRLWRVRDHGADGAEYPWRAGRRTRSHRRLLPRRWSRCFPTSTSAPSRRACWPPPTSWRPWCAGLQARPLRPLVVDPVMVATSGDVLLAPDAVDAVKRLLLPLQPSSRPICPRPRILLGCSQAETDAEMVAQAKALRAQVRMRCCSRAGMAPQETAVDILVDDRGVTRFELRANRHSPYPWHRLHAVGGHCGAAGAGSSA